MTDMQPWVDSLQQHLALLKAEPDGMAWRERRQLVREIRERLESSRAGAPELKLIHLLANDSRGEIRAEVAELLTFLPEQDFVTLAAKLVKDDYAFAAGAAERALARRRKGQDDRERREWVLDDVEEDYNQLARKYGGEAAELALKIAERLYETQVAGTIHTMRPLLSPLRVRLDDLAAMQEKGDIARAAHRGQLRKCAELAARLENHLLNMREYARPISSERTMERLAAIIGDAERRVRDALEADGKFPKHAHLESDVPNTINVHAAREQMVVAFSNLIRNAVEALPPKGGHVRIQACLDEENVVIAIRDTGMGLTETELKALRQFRPGRTTLKPHGSGCGMPQAYKTLRAHRGSLTLESQPGKGTTVRITLPIDGGEINS